MNLKIRSSITFLMKEELKKLKNLLNITKGSAGKRY